MCSVNSLSNPPPPPPRELLSPQQHYDWGLRALKTVLGGCGSLLAQEKLKDGGKSV